MCIDKCFSGTYTNSTIINDREADLQCKPCHPTCLTCNGEDTDSCTSCDHSSRLHSFFLDGTCAEACPSQQYVEYPRYKLCIHCGEHCLTCSNSSDATHANGDTLCTIKSAFTNVLLATTLHLAINANVSLFFTFSLLISCLACSFTCATCSSASHCLSCGPNFELLNGKCLQNCPAGTYTSEGECLSKFRIVTSFRLS